jgi:SAM-dependent methyltransferase
MVELLAPKPGETVLELAAAAGDTGFLAALLLGAGGRLITSDFVPEMVESARRRAAELGIGNADFRVLDAQQLDLQDASVDGVLCRWGYMLMPDPAVALAETRRVLGPGGRVAFAVWGSADENPWGSVGARVLLERGLMEGPEPDAPGPFRLHDPERLRALVAGAGLELVRLEDVGVTWLYESAGAYWQATRDLSHTLNSVLERLDETELAEVRAEVQEALAAYADGDGLALPGVSRVVLARRP